MPGARLNGTTVGAVYDVHMAFYKVVSDRFAVAAVGAQVSDADLSGCNVDALVAGGHLEPVKAHKADKTTTEGDK
jgi:hypothetical protein